MMYSEDISIGQQHALSEGIKAIECSVICFCTENGPLNRVNFNSQLNKANHYKREWFDIKIFRIPANKAKKIGDATQTFKISTCMPSLMKQQFILRLISLNFNNFLN